MAGFRTAIILSYASEPEARVVADALAVETTADLPKARCAVARAGADVTFSIEARDAPSLRAAVNSYLRWARVAEEAYAAATREKPT